MSGSPARRRVMGLLVYCGLITAMTSSLGALLVPGIAAEFDVSVATAQWVVTGSLLAGAVSTPLLGRLGDGHRARPTLLVVLSLIVIGSLLCVVATSYPLLMVGRVLQGLTFAVVPICNNLARIVLPIEEVSGAVATLSVTTATGVGLGFPLTGLLADTWGLRAAFAAALVVQIPALVAAVFWLPAQRRGDVPTASLPAAGGALLFAVAMVLLVGGLSGDLTDLGHLLVVPGLLVIGLWGWVQHRSARPLVVVGLLRRRPVLLANLTAMLIGASMHIGVVAVCQVAQAPGSTGYGLGASLFLTGCFVLPLSVGSQVSSRAEMAGLGLPGRVALGAGIALTGNVLIITAGEHATVLAGSMFLFGLGIGWCWAAAASLSITDVPMTEAGSMLAFNQILRPLGGAAGTAAAGWILATHSGRDGWPTSGAFEAVFAVSCVCCLVVLATTSLVRAGHRL